MRVPAECGCAGRRPTRLLRLTATTDVPAPVEGRSSSRLPQWCACRRPCAAAWVRRLPPDHAAAPSSAVPVSTTETSVLLELPAGDGWTVVLVPRCDRYRSARASYHTAGRIPAPCFSGRRLGGCLYGNTCDLLTWLTIQSIPAFPNGSAIHKLYFVHCFLPVSTPIFYHFFLNIAPVESGQRVNIKANDTITLWNGISGCFIPCTKNDAVKFLIALWIEAFVFSEISTVKIWSFSTSFHFSSIKWGR